MESDGETQTGGERPSEVWGRLGEALVWRLEQESGLAVAVDIRDVGEPRWVPLPEPAWLASTRVTLSLGDATQSVEVLWPVPWRPDHYTKCELWTESPVRPGSHEGCYVGRPLACGKGVRLQPGLHFIPRRSGVRTVVDVVLAPELGRDLRLREGKPRQLEGFAAAVVGKGTGRFVSGPLADQILSELGLDPGGRDFRDVAPAVAARRAETEDAPQEQARRTARIRNRVFGHDEVMAELVFTRFCSMLTKLRDPESSPERWLVDCRDRLQFAGRSALRAFAAGMADVVSVVSPAGPGMTLARVEQTARTCFVGFRGLGKVRGRADLRDLEAGWRGELCPVQTTESVDVGLVRFTAVGKQAAQAANLADWYDLSASAALIPFINHNDPARASIGSKNLKQAVPVVGCEPPLVATGWERLLGTAAGTARVPSGVSGEVGEVGEDFIEIRPYRGESRMIGFGPPWSDRSGVDNRWTVLVERGDGVEEGQILAHAPDVTVEDAVAGVAELCLGVNALVALTPWQGLNFEDAIVVSHGFAKRMTSHHLVRIAVDKTPDDAVQWFVRPCDVVGVGQTLASVVRRGDARGELRATADGEVVRVDQSLAEVSVTLRVARPLAVGDKLSNRHQNKGVVSAVLPVDQMPTLPDGTPVDVILNPLGVLRRLNIGQLWEMHVGMAARQEGTQRPVGRQLTDLPGLRDELARAGAPNGRVQLAFPDGAPGPKDGVVVGPQYLMKLDHLAIDKLSVRGDDPAISMVSHQPTQGARYRLAARDASRQFRRVGSAQRLGEMEVWALEAEGAWRVLHDALADRSGAAPWASDLPRASLRSIQAHLGVAGLELVLGAGETSPAAELRASEITSIVPVWRRAEDSAEQAPDGASAVGDLPTMPDWLMLGRSSEGLWRKWIGTPDARPAGYSVLMDAHRRGLGGAQIRALTGISGQQLSIWLKGDPELARNLEDAVREGKRRSGRSSSSQRLSADPSDLAGADRRTAALYEPSVHGEPGSRVAETTQWSIPLPAPIPHPWRVRGAPPLPRITSVPVLPPAYRRRNPSGARGLDYLYTCLVEAVQEFRRAASQAADSANTDEYREGQASAATRASARAGEYARRILGTPSSFDPDSILGRLSGKRGLLRRYLLGQAVNFSGRAVIVPDWNQDPDEIGLPSALARGLGVNGLEENGEVVFIVRQPTLQPHSIVALRARCLEPADGDAVRLHPIVLGGLAGDFDGDTIALHRPVSAEARTEAWELLSPSVRLRSSADSSLVAKLDLDIALGLYLASGTRKGRDELGRWFNDIPGRLDSSTLPDALGTLKLPSDNRAALQTLASIERFGLAEARGWSIGALDLVESGREGRMAEAIAAGVAGKAEAVSQLLDRRGAVAGAHPDSIAQPVEDSFLAGLSSDDYFATAPGALASLALKKLATPHAGAFTKTLVEIADAVVVECADCGAVGVRSPFMCRTEQGICQACYGVDPGTGQPPGIGERVGVLAGMLIGERWTQVSMKAFHGGGEAGEFDASLRELRGVFGRGASEVAFGVRANGKPESLLGFLRRQDTLDRETLGAALGPAVDRAQELLQRRVGKVHIALIMRQLVETFVELEELRVDALPGHRQLVSCAERRGRSRFETATSRGNVFWLLAAGEAGQDDSGGPRIRLATGGVL